MADTPEQGPTSGTLRFLKVLVTALAATMLLGMITLVWLFITRFPAPQSLTLPDEIILPDGTTATAFTRGASWYAVVTEGDEILIFDPDGALQQRIAIDHQKN
ncbi:MAG: DUF6476 family protein [Pseudomonadota bacterium]